MNQRIKNLSMIVASTIDGGIGANNDLPWKCREDMMWFKSFTTGKRVVMGYRTLESLRFKPLPNRKNYVIKSRTPTSVEGVAEYDMPCMLQIMDSLPDEQFVIIGGAKTYEAFMPYVSKAYVTTIYDKCVTDGVVMDTFMPELPKEFRLQGVPQAHDTCVVKCYVYDSVG